MNNELQFTISDQLFIETLLMELRGKSILYASDKKGSKAYRKQIGNKN